MRIALRVSNEIKDSMFITEAAFEENDLLSARSVLDAVSGKARASITTLSNSVQRTTSVALAGGKRLCPIVWGAEMKVNQSLLKFLSPSFPVTEGFRNSPTTKLSGNADTENPQGIPMSLVRTDSDARLGQTCAYLVPPEIRSKETILSPKAEVRWTSAGPNNSPGTLTGLHLKSGETAAAASSGHFSQYDRNGLNWIEVVGSIAPAANEICIAFYNVKLTGTQSYYRYPRSRKAEGEDKVGVVGREDMSVAVDINKGFALTHDSIRNEYYLVEVPLSLGQAIITEGMYYDISMPDMSIILQ